MKHYRNACAALLSLLLTLPLFSCGNTMEDGSSPSGSVIRITSVAAVDTALTPDLYLSECGDGTFEEGLTNSYVTVTMKNESRPNSTSATNSFVTMSRYRVDFTGLNMSVSLPSIDGAGDTVGISADGTGTMQVLVLDLATLEYIRSYYPSVGNGKSLTLKAHITIWGEDSFDTSVKCEADFTMVVDNYDRCG